MAFVSGYATAYFVFLVNILQQALFEAEVPHEVQGTMFHFPCQCCRNEIYFSTNSVIDCDKCNTPYKVSTKGNKLKVHLALEPGDEAHECVDCHGTFILKAGLGEKIIECPNPDCERQYYVFEKLNPHHSFYVKPIKRRKWW